MTQDSSSTPDLCFVDIETDSLDPSVIWCAVTCTKEDGYRVWARPDQNSDLSVYLAGKTLVGHNILGFDLPVLSKLAGFSYNWSSCIDTLVVSRLRNSWTIRDHSLEAWGERLGFPKGNFSDYSKLSLEMIDYCKQDVNVTMQLYKKFKPFLSNPAYQKSILLEHHSAYLCNKMQENGFKFDIEGAKQLYDEVLEQRDLLLETIYDNYPPRTVLLKEIIPRATKSGSCSRTDFRWLEETLEPERLGFSVGSPFSRFEYKEFNPNSTKDRIEVLWEAGWKPVDKTKGHTKAEREKLTDRLKHFATYGWAVNETNLATLPSTAPEGARKLAEYLTLDSRRSTLEEWFNAYNPATKRIHGNFNHILPWTHRKSHSNPNMGNIPSIAYEKDNPSPVEKINIAYNARMRALWGVPEDRVLVGVDAEGIQLRVLAHYIDNKEYTEAIVNGDKEDETDIHNLNKRALGLPHITRDDAKTFIYAWLLGAGVGKVSDILRCNHRQARVAMESFLDNISGLRDLKYRHIPRIADNGYFTGLDGRIVLCNTEHYVLAGLLQNGESVAMKWANRIWTDRLDAEGVEYLQVNDVHDEWQTECKPEDAEYVLEAQVEAISQAGRELNLRCPLAGSGNIGKNWKETH